jgi:octaprenyl-diphosphate synthase
MQIQDVFSAYKDDLQQVEECINEYITSEIKLIPEVAHHLIDSGGKRFRPLLLLISSGICGYHGRATLPDGHGMEFIHTATLLHDDVIDQASIRRGKTSANQIYGNAISVLVGDFLCFKSFTVADRDRQSRYFETYFPKWEISCPKAKYFNSLSAAISI